MLAHELNELGKHHVSHFRLKIRADVKESKFITFAKKNWTKHRNFYIHMNFRIFDALSSAHASISQPKSNEPQKMDLIKLFNLRTNSARYWTNQALGCKETAVTNSWMNSSLDSFEVHWPKRITQNQTQNLLWNNNVPECDFTVRC